MLVLPSFPSSARPLSPFPLAFLPPTLPAVPAWPPSYSRSFEAQPPTRPQRRRNPRKRRLTHGSEKRTKGRSGEVLFRFDPRTGFRDSIAVVEGVEGVCVEEEKRRGWERESENGKDGGLGKRREEKERKRVVRNGQEGRGEQDCHRFQNFPFFFV